MKELKNDNEELKKEIENIREILEVLENKKRRTNVLQQELKIDVGSLNEGRRNFLKQELIIDIEVKQTRRLYRICEINAE